MDVNSTILLFALFVGARAAPFDGKVSPALQDALQLKGRANIFVSFVGDTTEDLASITRTSRNFDRADQATTAYETLTAHALKTQSSVLSMLNSTRFFGLEVQSFWITNQIYVKGADAGIVNALVSMTEISGIEEEITIQANDPINEPQNRATKSAWGIKKIHAEKAWEFAGIGDGATVGVIDTGVRYTHEAIKAKFVGGSHAWYDPYSLTKSPTDGHGRGTHVTGTILGDGIGVAPGAKWIACKGFKDDGSAIESKLLECGQFMMCPHDHKGKNHDCSLSPDVVSHAWGKTVGKSRNFYDATIRALMSVNTIPVFAAGDSGPKCRSIVSPADSSAAPITVGATTAKDAIADYSSRGPSATGHQQPDVCAPGSEILSAGIESDSAYTAMSGTAMASAHVTGLVALLKSQILSSNIRTIKSVLTTTANTKDLVFDKSVCNGVSESKLPSFAFGYGRINALAAVMAL